jgi:hypothetical protein
MNRAVPLAGQSLLARPLLPPTSTLRKQSYHMRTSTCLGLLDRIGITRGLLQVAGDGGPQLGDLGGRVAGFVPVCNLCSSSQVRCQVQRKGALRRRTHLAVEGLAGAETQGGVDHLQDKKYQKGREQQLEKHASMTACCGNAYVPSEAVRRIKPTF